ncbi:MAG: siderophore-mediated iron transporter [Epsilonproteobacteria bacterium]|nr:MAG: siderophore-mediated iron transporter [Campylobacterota bacterium]
MKNLILTIFLAFLISLVIHFLLYATVQNKIQNKKLQISTTNKIQEMKKKGFTSIKYVKLKKIEQIKPEKIKKTIKKIVKKRPKKVIKKIVKKQIKKSKIKKVPILKEIKAIQSPKIEPKIDFKSLFTISKTKEVIPLEKQKQQKQLEEQQEIKELKQLDKLTQSYIKLYGKKYFTFSKVQKRYLKDNLSLIGKVTQKYLRYPSISIRTRQSGINVIEFFLHPNGDITDVKITDSSYYTALDQNTIDTIQISYQDYPKPTQTVKIKIYVKYVLN